VQLLGNRNKVTHVSQFNVTIHISLILILLNKILDVIDPRLQTAIKRAEEMLHDLAEIEIRSLQAGEDTTAFRTLNEEWITRYFILEKTDRETLGDPENKILKKGGSIFMAHFEGHAVGCVALIPVGDGLYEVSKMAVSPQLRGLGIGRKLLQHAVTQARIIGARSLFLASNARLENAVHLYESIGFRHVPPESLPANAYSRANVFMEMPF
jgi:putative acetyltransferase